MKVIIFLISSFFTFFLLLITNPTSIRKVLRDCKMKVFRRMFRKIKLKVGKFLYLQYLFFFQEKRNNSIVLGDSLIMSSLQHLPNQRCLFRQDERWCSYLTLQEQLTSFCPKFSKSKKILFEQQ